MQSFLLASLLLLIVESSLGQSVAESLHLRDNQDFLTYAQRNVHFPASAIRNGTTAKVYVGFRLNDQGSVQNVSILNPQLDSYDFEQQVITAFNHLPKQAAAYQGEYALAYSFSYRNEPEPSNLTTSQEHELVGSRQLLPEVKLSVSVSRPQRQASFTNLFRLPVNH